MNVQTKSYEGFLPGVRLHNGNRTLFYNGEILYEKKKGFPIYDNEERDTWEVIIILPGVKAIPSNTFFYCGKVEKVFMTDSVRAIGDHAFYYCERLKSIEFSRKIDCIGGDVFTGCIGEEEFKDYIYNHSKIIARISREIQTETFTPGSLMYKCKKTLFYNGEKLWDNDVDDHDDRVPRVYNWKERYSWEVIVILQGVEVIPENTFAWCDSVEMVIMADTVKRIEEYAFFRCEGLKYFQPSRNLEHIGMGAFVCCYSLTSFFAPPSCLEIYDEESQEIDHEEFLEIGPEAFGCCRELFILHINQHTHRIIGSREDSDTRIEKIHCEEEFALHRICSSYNPPIEDIYQILKHQGLGVFAKEDSIGATPLKYLTINPFAEIKEEEIIKRYILDMMGELI